MPSINEFIGPKPDKKDINNLEKIIGVKPCFKCDLNVDEYFWDPIQYVVSWTCSNGHSNTVSVNN